jgi:hypothetical protein
VATGGNGNLSLAAGVSFDNIVNVPSSEVPGDDRIEPTSPGTSYLFEKITDDTPAVGGRMPLGLDPLSAGEIDTIEDWITSGAPE